MCCIAFDWHIIMLNFKLRKKKKKYNKSKKGGGYPNMVLPIHAIAHYPYCDVIMVIGTLLYLEANGYQQIRKRFHIC